MCANNCKPGPGKFEGESALTVMAYAQMCLGNGDASAGRYEFFRSPLNFTADAEAVSAAHSAGFCDQCIEEAEDYGRTLYGVAVWDSDQGFAMLREFGSEAEYDAALRDAEAEGSEDDA